MVGKRKTRVNLTSDIAFLSAGIYRIPAQAARVTRFKGLPRIRLHSCAPSYACVHVLVVRRASTLLDSHPAHVQAALRTYPFGIVRDPLSSRITIAREWKPCVCHTMHGRGEHRGESRESLVPFKLVSAAPLSTQRTFLSPIYEFIRRYCRLGEQRGIETSTISSRRRRL